MRYLKFLLALFFLTPTLAFAYTIQTATGLTSAILVLDDDDAGGQSALGTQFTTIGSGTLTTTGFCVYKHNGTPATDVVLTLYSDSAGSPGTALASTTLSAASITTTHQEVVGTFSEPVSASTPYWIIASSPGLNGSGTDYADCGNNASSDTSYVYHRSGSFHSFTGTDQMTLTIDTGGGGGGMGTTTPICPPTATSTDLGVFQQGFCDVFGAGNLMDTGLPIFELLGSFLFALIAALVILRVMLGGARKALRSSRP